MMHQHQLKCSVVKVIWVTDKGQLCLFKKKYSSTTFFTVAYKQVLWSQINFLFLMLNKSKMSCHTLAKVISNSRQKNPTLTSRECVNPISFFFLSFSNLSFSMAGRSINNFACSTSGSIEVYFKNQIMPTSEFSLL